MFDEFDTLPAVVPTPEELKSRFAAPFTIVRTPEERQALDTAKRRLRFDVGKRLRAQSGVKRTYLGHDR